MINSTIVDDNMNNNDLFDCPVFTKHLVSLDNGYENGQAKFEAKIEPGNDASLHVEWYKNGKILNLGKFSPFFFPLLFSVAFFFPLLWKSASTNEEEKEKANK